jgi:hypothetical protein
MGKDSEEDWECFSAHTYLRYAEEKKTMSLQSNEMSQQTNAPSRAENACMELLTRAFERNSMSTILHDLASICEKRSYVITPNKESARIIQKYKKLADALARLAHTTDV